MSEQATPYLHDLGMTRAEAQARFAALGYRFPPTLTPRGRTQRPHMVGEASDQRASVEFIGPEEHVFKAAILVPHPGHNPTVYDQTLADLTTALTAILPQWQHGVAWLADHYAQAVNQHAAETQVHNLTVELRATDDRARMVLTITWKPA